MSTQKLSEPKALSLEKGQLIPSLAEVQQLAMVLQALKGLGSNSQPTPDASDRVSDAEWAQLVVDAFLKRLQLRRRRQERGPTYRRLSSKSR